MVSDFKRGLMEAVAILVDLQAANRAETKCEYIPLINRLCAEICAQNIDFAIELILDRAKEGG